MQPEIGAPIISFETALLIIVIWFWGSAGCGRIFAIIIPSNHREEA
jgi:hypothetical protein